MSINPKILTIILLTSLIIYLMRYLPIAVLYRRSISPLFARYLKYLPVAILTALVIQSVFIKDGRPYPGTDNYYWMGFLFTICLTFFTRSLLIIVFGSLGFLYLINLLL